MGVNGIRVNYIVGFVVLVFVFRMIMLECVVRICDKKIFCFWFGSSDFFSILV